MLAILIAALVLFPGAALAVIDTSTGSTIDLAPVLNPLIQMVAAIITGSAGVIVIYAINWVRGKLQMQKIEKDAAMQSRIDDIAQKIIGGAMARANIVPGRLVLDVKNDIIADAGNKIAGALGKELSALGVNDVGQRARDIVENRLGMMAATAAGTPIPGPTATPMPAAIPPEQPKPVVVAVEGKSP